MVLKELKVYNPGIYFHFRLVDKAYKRNFEKNKAYYNKPYFSHRRRAVAIVLMLNKLFNNSWNRHGRQYEELNFKQA